jgi:hypothetical protein
MIGFLHFQKCLKYTFKKRMKMQKAQIAQRSELFFGVPLPEVHPNQTS